MVASFPVQPEEPRSDLVCVWPVEGLCSSSDKARREHITGGDGSVSVSRLFRGSSRVRSFILEPLLLEESTAKRGFSLILLRQVLALYLT